MGSFRLIHRLLGWLRSIFVVLSASIPALTGVPIEKAARAGGLAVWLVNWCIEWHWLVVPILLTLASILGIARRKIVDPEANEELQDALDDLHHQMFPNAVDERSRITLFKFQRWQLKEWPFWPKRGGWLVPVKRSGEMHQDFKARFMVGDELTKTCGIAGKAWCDVADAVVQGLPDVHSGQLKKRALAKYAKLTFVGEDWVEDHRPKSRSFIAMKIRAKRKKWGVVVVDSEDEELDHEKILEIFRHTANFLSGHVRRV